MTTFLNKINADLKSESSSNEDGKYEGRPILTEATSSKTKILASWSSCSGVKLNSNVVFPNVIYFDRFLLGLLRSRDNTRSHAVILSSRCFCNMIRGRDHCEMESCESCISAGNEQRDICSATERERALELNP